MAAVLAIIAIVVALIIGGIVIAAICEAWSH